MTKICIPIVAKAVEKAILDIKKAEKFSNLLELRIDYIKDINENKLIDLLKNCSKEIIVTCRPKNKGGKFLGIEEERIKLLIKAIQLEADFIDIEIESDKSCITELISNKNKTKIILSHHNFNETLSLEFLEKKYNEMSSLNPNLIKIVTKANSINDCFTIFKLLEDKNNLIAMCMGKKGQISRILAGKFNLVFTYASLEKGLESAEGQINVNELEKIYNFSKTNNNTKLLGVIGEYAENSKSKYMHNTNFKRYKLNYVYVPLKVLPNELEEFMVNFKQNFSGSAVTIPHKLAIVSYMDSLDDTVKKIGATNTLVHINNKWVGYNTDFYGAIHALKEKTELNMKKVLVIGAGGAARAIVYGLKLENAKITIINRTKEKAEKLALEFKIRSDHMENMKELIKKNDIIINTTSIGMNPNPDKSIIPKEFLIKEKILMDIVYNPIKTKLIREANQAGCVTITGDRMLVHQAIGQFHKWTGIKPIFEDMENALKKHIGD